MNPKSYKKRFFIIPFILFFALTLPITAQRKYKTQAYTVQQGDTLSGIAQRFGVTLDSIVTLNNIANTHWIWAGQALILPDNETSNNGVEAASEPEANPPTAENESPVSISDSYVVQRGDTLTKIAADFGLDLKDVINSNRSINPHSLAIGQAINLPNGEKHKQNIEPATPQTTSPVIQEQKPATTSNAHTVRYGESLSSIALKYGISLATLHEANPEASRVLQVGQQLNIPQVGHHSIAVLGEIFWPVDGRWVIKGYHYGHRAIDIVVANGTPVHSLGAGTVEFSGWSTVGYGYMIMIDHGDDVHTLYAHMSDLQVQKGDLVSRDQIIGLSGNTGNSTRPHLHLEIREGFSAINPCSYLEGGC